MKRRKLTKKKSTRLFKRGAARVNRKNTRRQPKRGGYRL